MSGNMRDYSSGYFWQPKPKGLRGVRQPKARKGRQSPSSKALTRHDPWLRTPEEAALIRRLADEYRHPERVRSGVGES